MNKVSIWKVNRRIDGKQIKVATIENGERKESMCAGCSAPCCKGFLKPVLNAQEFLSRKFPMEFVLVPDGLDCGDAELLAVLKVGNSGCGFLENNKCTVWPDCPSSCLAYDCREDTRTEIRTFALARQHGRNGSN